MTVLATDTFDRADNEDLGANWTVVTGEAAGFEIISNWAQPSDAGGTLGNGYDAGDRAEIYTGASWPDAQYAQATIDQVAGTNNEAGIGVLLRGAGGAQTYYRIVVNAAASNNIEVGKIVTGAFTSLGQLTSGTWAGGTHILKVQISGFVFSVYRDGAFVGNVTDGGSSIPSGYAGVAYSSTLTDGVLLDWEGGDLADQIRLQPAMVGRHAF